MLINIHMKIKELISPPKKSHDTTSSGTIYSIESEPQALDLVPQNHVPEKIVATCFQKLDPAKGAKIRKKRRAKAGIAGKKLGITKRTGAGARRLAGIQIKQKKLKGKSLAPKRKASKPVKSRTIKPKKR